ncbi:hypothetical protein [Pseudomonas laurylsulfatiphila]|uniref:hypothetical protein n=1 Tax=Pseudomonas laurylsulfatiphila TaxID=2011015 RepID=UPI00215FB850|nr:hypothetical protein [Pseudomonas laurylsulfatiphila]UVM05728.1 hypothetical protein LOY25_03205 [Pseudomonas laurylsulfatiphila]
MSASKPASPPSYRQLPLQNIAKGQKAVNHKNMTDAFQFMEPARIKLWDASVMQYLPP